MMKRWYVAGLNVPCRKWQRKIEEAFILQFRIVSKLMWQLTPKRSMVVLVWMLQCTSSYTISNHKKTKRKRMIKLYDKEKAIFSWIGLNLPLSLLAPLNVITLGQDDGKQMMILSKVFFQLNKPASHLIGLAKSAFKG